MGLAALLADTGVAYAVGCLQAPEKRGPGFGISFPAAVALQLMALAASVTMRGQPRRGDPMKARQLLGWGALAVGIAVAVWLLATGRRTPGDALALLNWVVPLILGYLLGLRTERQRHRRLRQSRRERRSTRR